MEEASEFTDVQLEIYQLLMQSYTINIGDMVDEPEIVTTCVVTEQEVAGGSSPEIDNTEDGRRGRERKKMRRRMRTNNGQEQLWSGMFLRRAFLRPSLFRGVEDKDDIHGDRQIGTLSLSLSSSSVRRLRRSLQATRNLIVLSFTMTYTTHYGYEISDYPFEFSNYIANNLPNVTADMIFRFLPVVEAKEVIVYNPDPTIAPSVGPTLSTEVPSGSPVPTAKPTPMPTQGELINDKPSFIVGLAAGLTFAGLVVLFSIGYVMWQRRRRRHKEGGGTRGIVDDDSPQPWEAEEGIEVVVADYSKGMRGMMSSMDEEKKAMSSPSAAVRRSLASRGETVLSSPSHNLSNPSMVSEGEGSLSSTDDQDYQSRNDPGGVRVDALQDEFDQYKNEDLEHMRNGVERSVYGAEGMMSLAMTRALMDEEDADVHPSWGEAEDPESIEANALCETNDWLRKNEFTSLEERNVFFQELLNRMVITVRRGMTSPTTGTLAIHCCAAMLGLQLEKDLPNNVLLVHGMRKINDLTLGRKYLVDAFMLFGEIEGAAIAPCNRGFGFVRFVSPKSVQRALERFKISEIEVQDVSVMIKPLKADADAMALQY